MAAPRLIQSRQNARVKELRAGVSAAGDIAIEGEHLLAEAAASGLKFSTVFVEQGQEARLARLHLPTDAELLAVAPDVFASAVHTESPQGVAALVRLPLWTLNQVLDRRGPALVMVSGGLQDPGNLGTLIRSAEAFGATGFVMLPGTVSVANQKVLRASAGSAFRLSCVTAKESEFFAALEARGIKTVAAVAVDGGSATSWDFTQPTALLLGNEGAGLAASLVERANARVTIPMPGPVESLNVAVAGSVLLYEAARQRGGAR
ncbi:RNA methyltransferase [Silvibacterium dinghuense]|uniref:RNA methyltransferase n=1 Tax=Silvibacterium dinghuense TaxID=1560006 RepID=A0A4Q1SF68_9BACT|nr:RNA methyltransferase [Silvibacterium dinghuense]